MVIKAQEFWFVVIVGGVIGFTAAGPRNSIAPASAEDRQELYKEARIEQPDPRVKQQAALHLHSNEGVRKPVQMGHAYTPTQRWALAVLESGQPLSVRQMAALSQIVNGISIPSMPIYETSRRAGSDRMGYTNNLEVSVPMPSSFNRPGTLGTAKQQTMDDTDFSQYQAPATNSPNLGAVNNRTGEYYAPVGLGAYVNVQDGTFYAPAGQHGVIDTRTGRYIPVNP